MLKFNLDPANAHESSKEKVFPHRTEREQNVHLMFFIKNPKVVPGWVKLGHIGDYFCPCQGITTMMRKGKSKKKIKKYFLLMAENLADLICQHMGFP